MSRMWTQAWPWPKQQSDAVQGNQAKVYMSTSTVNFHINANELVKVKLNWSYTLYVNVFQGKV